MHSRVTGAGYDTSAGSGTEPCRFLAIFSVSKNDRISLSLYGLYCITEMGSFTVGTCHLPHRPVVSICACNAPRHGLGSLGQADFSFKMLFDAKSQAQKMGVEADALRNLGRLAQCLGIYLRKIFVLYSISSPSQCGAALRFLPITGIELRICRHAGCTPNSSRRPLRNAPSPAVRHPPCYLSCPPSTASSANPIRSRTS